MAGINVSDKTHDEIREMSYETRTDMKTVVEWAWKFANERSDEFLKEIR
ncbi:MAG: hypothetical protein U9R21_04330 [Candidatus Thermoplasmatota archaeon]|nr:hypothetical protein [Candidatus Thermoplasmatota archaeon]